MLKKGVHNAEKRSAAPVSDHAHQTSLQEFNVPLVTDAPSEGLLRMRDVKDLPDDVDQIVNQFKTVDFATQDLDVLIELSKQLKCKRLGLFPDSNYMLTL